MKSFISNFLFAVLFFHLQALSALAEIPQGEIPYYGSSFYQDVRSGLSDRALTQALNIILKSTHTFKENQFDLIAPQCQGPACTQHLVLGYNRARKYLMGEFSLPSGEKS